MTDFDALLRETLQDRARTLDASPDTLKAVTVRARRIRRRRKAAAAAAAALAVTLVAVLLGSPDRDRPAANAPGVGRVEVRGLGKPLDGAVRLGDSLYLVDASGRVARLDKAGKVAARSQSALDSPGQQLPFAFGASAGDLAVSGGRLWLLGSGPGARYYLQRLDPVNLRVVQTVPVGGPQAGSLVGARSSIWAMTGSGEAVRMDAATGTVSGRLRVTGALPPHLFPDSLSLVTVDEQAGVAWLSGQVNDGLPVLLPARVSADRLTVLGATFYPRLGTGRLAPGENGTLWVVTGRNVSHLAPEPQGTGLRRLPVGPYLSNVPSGETWELAASGTRLWTLQHAPDRTTLVCLDRATGDVKRRYPLPGTDHRTSSFQVTGDGHQVYLTHGTALLTIQGPDPCLS